MKVAIPVWNLRISPLFDTARNLLIVEVDKGEELSRYWEELEGYFPPWRARKLLDLGVETLICGGISRQLAAMLYGSGITVLPWMSGFVEDVLQAYLGGKLPDQRFLMPGCHRLGFRGRPFGGGGRSWWRRA